VPAHLLAGDGGTASLESAAALGNFAFSEDEGDDEEALKSGLRSPRGAAGSPRAVLTTQAMCAPALWEYSMLLPWHVAVNDCCNGVMSVACESGSLLAPPPLRNVCAFAVSSWRHQHAPACTCLDRQACTCRRDPKSGHGTPRRSLEPSLPSATSNVSQASSSSAAAATLPTGPPSAFLGHQSAPARGQSPPLSGVPATSMPLSTMAGGNSSAARAGGSPLSSLPAPPAGASANDSGHSNGLASEDKGLLSSLKSRLTHKIGNRRGREAGLSQDLGTDLPAEGEGDQNGSGQAGVRTLCDLLYTCADWLCCLLMPRDASAATSYVYAH
jgi:hypothetical protein